MFSFFKKLNTRLNKLSIDVSNRMDGIRNTDASVFNDDIALLTDWMPLDRKGSSNVGAVRAIKVSAERIQLKGSIVTKVFLTIIILPWWFLWFFNDFELGLFLGLIGLYIAYLSFSPIYFDRKLGFKDGWLWATDDENIDLQEIHALQIIRGRHGGGPGAGYTTFELNLVSHSGARVAVTRLSSLPATEEIAEELSEFLNIEVWNSLLQSSKGL